MTNLSLILLAICAALAHCAFADGVAFPATDTNVSPNRIWEIRSQRNQEQEDYSLILRNRRTGAERRIFTGGRWCEVLWSADGSKIAVTDWMGSDCSQILLQSTEQKGSARSLADATARAYLTEVEKSGHCYWEALRWEADGRLRIRVFGHTDEKPLHEFAYEFIFDSVRKSATLVKKEGGPRSRAEQKIWASKEIAWKEESSRTNGLSR